MKTQQDSHVRVVALENLRAMCDRVSGTAHRYTVSKVSRSRVHVEYSNPDEYATDHPVTVVFPCYPSNWLQDGADNPRILFDPLRLFGDGADWDMFSPLESCPTLWRDYPDATTERWESHADVLTRQGKTDMDNRRANGSCPSCVVCDVK